MSALMETEKTPEQVREEWIARILTGVEETLRRELPDRPQSLDRIGRAAEEMGELIKRKIQHEMLVRCSASPIVQARGLIEIGRSGQRRIHAAINDPLVQPQPCRPHGRNTLHCIACLTSTRTYRCAQAEVRFKIRAIAAATHTRT
jgi:hypothetical protein